LNSLTDHICEMTNTGFDAILNKKGSSGQLTFNHKEKTLDLMVQKDNTNEGSQTADVKALSGGERSYTTLSLLLALGECLETPFRVMDEFDVFLDVKARKLALTTMIALAKQMSHRQFIFITPQDLSDIKTDETLFIHHMKPPDRSQLVGGLQQQTLD
jgi:structural maintenance of chromosomes protein 6